MEAEYIAALEAAMEVVWMKSYIPKLGVVLSIAEPVVIFCNKTREMVSRGDIKMDRVSSAENTADPLTKLTLQITHTQDLDKMGLRSIGDWL
ncbi:UNVERIFIED_CONTAM: hypothetical protein Slati_0147000 [Sesamum latifolium]|uniref:Uncharacterized protein n=1 Tax=Sesamum latifolium TaxID=2727402 RepID=A0AAW2Y9W9_9LAMI